MLYNNELNLYINNFKENKIYIDNLIYWIINNNILNIIKYYNL